MTSPFPKALLRFAALWLSILGAAILTPAQAQVSLSTTPTTETFDSLGPSATAPLPSGFRVDKPTAAATLGTFAAAGTATEQVDGANLASNAANGIYNFGSGTNDTGPDRAVGFLSSGTATKSGNLYVQLRNDTGASVSQIPLSYNVEKYRNGSNAAGFRVQLFFSTDGGTSFTSAGNSFLTSFPADANNNGGTPAPLSSTSVSGTLTLPMALSPSSSVVLAWNYSVASGTVTSNAQALAIDDFSFAATLNSPTATPTPTAPPVPSATGGALINEFRTGGPNGERDEFIEVYNQTNVPLDLTAWTLASNGVTVGTIPSGKAIPPYGRLLLTGNTYSLANTSGVNAALGDVAIAGDVTLGGALELRNASGTVVDTVTPGSLAAPTSATSNYSFVRRMDGPGGAATLSSAFNTVDVNSTSGPGTSIGISDNVLRLGAPGPQNLSSPTVANNFITFASAGPFVRTGSGDSGTLAFRNVITNRANTGRTLTALRFRLVAVTAGTAPTGTADVRLASSSAGGTILPLILETPPAQPLGGGLNTSGTVSLSALPGGGLAPGQSVTVEFFFNIFQRGSFRYLVNLEPATTEVVGETLPDDHNRLLGNPSGAVAVATPSSATAAEKENLLIDHNAESLGYAKSLGGPRWVSWHLDNDDLGTADRGNFRTDPDLPEDCRITNSDYTGSGFDRGHMCPSGDRTASDALNDETFFMSNILPQTVALNQRVWVTLEDYCRDQVKNQGQECYILSGGVGSSGTIAGGQVNVPASCWKVVVILPRGTNDLNRINSQTRVIAVLMPNTTTVTGNYSNYTTTVDAIESATGLDLLSNLPDAVENALEARNGN